MSKKYIGKLSVFLISLAVILPLNKLNAEKESTAERRIKVIIDTDIAEDIDDILVTAFALNSPEFDVLAITTVDGNVQARSRVARKVALLYGRPEVEVAGGGGRRRLCQEHAA